MSRNHLLIILLSIVGTMLAIAACSGPEEREIVDVPKVLPTTDKGNCPIKVPGVKATTADAADKISVTYVTETGDIDELRRRVKVLGDMYNKLAARPVVSNTAAAPQPGEGTGGSTRMKSREDVAVHEEKRMMPMATATVVDADNGAKITLVPAGETNAHELKTFVGKRATAMGSGECMLPQLDAPGKTKEATTPAE